MGGCSFVAIVPRSGFFGSKEWSVVARSEVSFALEAGLANTGTAIGQRQPKGGAVDGRAASRLLTGLGRRAEVRPALQADNGAEASTLARPA